MLLSDVDIKSHMESGEIYIDPWEPSNLQPASVDVTLGSVFARYSRGRYSYVDTAEPVSPYLLQQVHVGQGSGVQIEAGEFMLGCLREHIRISASLGCRIEGKSSLARVGLAVHVTAGFVDPGWNGILTLEMVNHSPLPIILHPGIKIAHVSFMRLLTPAEKPYGSLELRSRYQDSTSMIASRYGW